MLKPCQIYFVENFYKILYIPFIEADKRKEILSLTNKEILEIAMRQSAEDIGCLATDFLSDKNIVVPRRPGKNVRKYYKEPIACNLVSYGNSVVAAATDEIFATVSEFVGKYRFYNCFETPDMHWLNELLVEKGHKVCFMAEYYLPDVDHIPDLDCPYEVRLLVQKDFENLYLPEWSNALCEERKNLDVLGLGAYDGGKLVGFAACSADCDDMWQIGVDVLPEYRRKGIASALTSSLAKEILKRGKVPFYCSAWSNIRSVRNAVKSGFIPAWVELSAKSIEAVDALSK